jgi:hypothetical protein
MLREACRERVREQAGHDGRPEHVVQAFEISPQKKCIYIEEEIVNFLHRKLEILQAQVIGQCCGRVEPRRIRLRPQKRHARVVFDRRIACKADDHERAGEERRGIVRWLRPEFQNPTGTASAQGALALPAAARASGKQPAAKRPPWPKNLAEQARAVTRAPIDKVADLLETLATLGQVRAAGEGRYVA